MGAAEDAAAAMASAINALRQSSAMGLPSLVFGLGPYTRPILCVFVCMCVCVCGGASQTSSTRALATGEGQRVATRVLTIKYMYQNPYSIVYA
jgi:hypothetical protein